MSLCATFDTIFACDEASPPPFRNLNLEPWTETVSVGGTLPAKKGHDRVLATVPDLLDLSNLVEGWRGFSLTDTSYCCLTHTFWLSINLLSSAVSVCKKKSRIYRNSKQAIFFDCLGKKIFWSKKNFGQFFFFFNFGPKKCWVQKCLSPKQFGSRRLWVKKI